MKKYYLSIKLPLFKSFTQQTVLDSLLNDRRITAYERSLVFKDGEYTEEYEIRFLIG